MENEKTKFKNYYLNEFELFDGECYITFNIVHINFDSKTITVAITNRGKITVQEFELKENENGSYFEYGIYQDKLNIDDFEEVDE